MTKLITFPRKVRKAHSGNAASILDKLDGYLNSNKGWQAEILYSCWGDQKNAITYSELREAVSSGVLSKEMIENWQHDYSVLVSEKLTGLWENAIKAGAAGQPIFDSMSFSVNTQAPGVTAWIRERGAQFVTASTEEQKKAIASLLIQKNSGKYTVDELARLIRPTIGLTEGAAKATARVYDNVLKTLKEEHPKMKAETARRKALDSAQKYAERAHRQRAQTIAQTEAAFAYNRGADFGVRQAQEKGLLGYCVKVWVTSGDDAVCATCASLEGTEIGVDDSFGYGGKTLFEGQHLLPPAHPRCACAVEYVEKESPLFSQMASAEEDMYEEG